MRLRAAVGSDRCWSGRSVTGCGAAVSPAAGPVPARIGARTTSPGRGPTGRGIGFRTDSGPLGPSSLGTAAPADDAAAVPLPTGAPLITVTQGTNSWIASWTTQPSRSPSTRTARPSAAEDLGTVAEPLPELTIGRLDSCAWHRGGGRDPATWPAPISAMPGVTDQGTTSVTVHDRRGRRGGRRLCARRR